MARSKNVYQELAAIGVKIRAASHATVREEIPEAYKNLDLVVDVVDRVGLSRKVARQRPIGVVKG